MEKRYQIFISSTYTDLKEERDKVMRAVLDLNYFPAGMEQFPAVGIAPIDLIKSVLKDCDYYILIIGARYGSIGKNGKSYTEEEYDYAVAQGIPVIAFLHGNPKSIPIEKSDKNDKTRKKLESFRKKVEEGGHTVKYWNNPDDLSSKVLSSIPKAINYQPRVGWVRADSVVSGDANETIDKLERQIESYKNDLQKLEEDLKKKEEDNHALETSNQEAQKEIVTLQKKIETLQDKLDELKAQNEQNKKDRSVLEQSYQKAQDKISIIESELGSLLKKLKSDSELQKSLLDIATITIPGTDVSFNMVYVEGGSFMMGANENDEEAFSNEKPAHLVTLSDYWIGETQVTQALWETVMGANPSFYKGDSNRPVECIDWDNCQEFIKKLNELTGKTFCMLTEAQWEFAARGGNLGKDHGCKYAGSDDIKQVAWYHENSDDETHAVAQKKANELGLYDMSGNIREWCQDWYGDYTIDAQSNPTGPSSGSFRVCRGGSWYGDTSFCRVSKRHSNIPTNKASRLGLRLALSSTSINNAVN